MSVTHYTKCIVNGCTNRTGEGTFEGDICRPCYTMLTTGKVNYGTTFIHHLFEDLQQVARKIEFVLDQHK